MRSILLIDDKNAAVRELETELRERLPSDKVEIKTWVPSGDERDPREVFNGHIDKETTLVITDSDLTSQGQTGFFGASVVAWCQKLAIPVGDYSRIAGELPKEPDLFELRVPPDPVSAAPIIASLFQGFSVITDALVNSNDLSSKRNPSAVLAEILGRPELENQLALYAIRLGAASGALMDMVEHPEPAKREKESLLSYIVGHLLLNVLRFPGPILSLQSLKAYLASDEAGAEDVVGLFDAARYGGPFAGLDKYYWLTDVDGVLEKLVETLGPDVEYETHGEVHRAAVEAKLRRELRRHGCPRCEGKNGGFFCPFTMRIVCQRADCSVGSNSWIPQGAALCRIEREFYDEWAPLLGL